MAQKVIEIVGSSKESFGKAAENAVAEAAKTVRGMKWARGTKVLKASLLPIRSIRRFVRLRCILDLVFPFLRFGCSACLGAKADGDSFAYQIAATVLVGTWIMRNSFADLEAKSRICTKAASCPTTAARHT